MKHASYPVDIVNEAGNVIATKKRRDINKKTDLYHTVFVVIRTPENDLLLSRVPRREDLPNLYPEKHGLTAATIRHHGEDAESASLRVLKNELGLDNVRPTFVGENFMQLLDGYKSYFSVYRLDHPIPKNISHADIGGLQAFSSRDMENAIKVNNTIFTLTFLSVWQKYKDKLLSD